MLRRTGFKRPQIERKAPVYTPIARPVNTGPVELVAMPKNPPGRNSAFRNLARGRECMFRIPGECSFNPEQTVLAHSNESRHGKSMGMKADDAIGSVFACYACHFAIDQGGMSSEQKAEHWVVARARMKAALEKIVASPSEKEKDRAAAAWALERINAHSIAASPM